MYPPPYTHRINNICRSIISMSIIHILLAVILVKDNKAWFHQRYQRYHPHIIIRVWLYTCMNCRIKVVVSQVFVRGVMSFSGKDYCLFLFFQISDRLDWSTRIFTISIAFIFIRYFIICQINNHHYSSRYRLFISILLKVSPITPTLFSMIIWTSSVYNAIVFIYA